MAFGSDNSEAGTISQINVTPLVDVMLVLLVIFMVTAPILQQGVTINLPKVAAGGIPGDEQQLVVTLNKHGKLYLNDEPMTLDGLTPKLQAIVQMRPDRQVFLRADEGVPYGQVMRVIAAVKGAGIERLGMVTEPPEQQGR